MPHCWRKKTQQIMSCIVVCQWGIVWWNKLCTMHYWHSDGVVCCVVGCWVKYTNCLEHHSGWWWCLCVCLIDALIGVRTWAGEPDAHCDICCLRLDFIWFLLGNDGIFGDFILGIDWRHLVFGRLNWIEEAVFYLTKFVLFIVRMCGPEKGRLYDEMGRNEMI